MITEFPVAGAVGSPLDIAAGMDGNLWFTESTTAIGRVTTVGTISGFPVPLATNSTAVYAGPDGIAAGPDGKLWFTEIGGNTIRSITTAGTISEFPIPTPSSVPVRIASGPDGNLWFTEANSNAIGRLTPASGASARPEPSPNSRFQPRRPPLESPPARTATSGSPRLAATASRT
jgi:virginiamycin B lyase